MNLCVIPARSGSSRIKDKNVRLFHGKPLMAFSIETARESGLFKEIVVSTDSVEYAAIAKGYGANVHMRARRLADDIVGTQEVMKAALTWWRSNHEGNVPDVACCLYATAPLLLPSDLIAGMSMLGAHPYAYVPGYYYFGNPLAFIGGVPLDAGIEVPFPQSRYIDINTEDDFQKAERMYAEMEQGKRIADQIDEQIFQELTR